MALGQCVFGRFVRLFASNCDEVVMSSRYLRSNMCIVFFFYFFFSARPVSICSASNAVEEPSEVLQASVSLDFLCLYLLLQPDLGLGGAQSVLILWLIAKLQSVHPTVKNT